mgnify:CR=1 FL=1
MNRFQGVLPLLFDRDPKRVLFMCFGSGVTCGTLALSGVQKRVETMLTMTGAHNFLTMHATEADAVRALGGMA